MVKKIKQKWYLIKLWYLRQRYKEIDNSNNFNSYDEYIKSIENIDSEMLTFKNKLKQLNDV